MSLSDEKDKRNLQLEMGSTSMAECLLDARASQLTILTSLPSSLHQKNPINTIQDGDVRYISILADKKEIEARLKSVGKEPLSVLSVGLVQDAEPETSTAPAKRSRKSHCPSRPKKRTANKSASLPLEEPDWSFPCPVPSSHDESQEAKDSTLATVVPVTSIGSSSFCHALSPSHNQSPAIHPQAVPSSISSCRPSTDSPANSTAAINSRSCIVAMQSTALCSTMLVPVSLTPTASSSYGSSIGSPARSERVMAVQPASTRLDPSTSSSIPGTGAHNVFLDNQSAFPKFASDGDGMQQLLAAVRQGLTGSLLAERSPSSSAYHSPRRVISPSGQGFASPVSLVSSPVRLPSIGEFFTPTPAHTPTTSPHQLDSVVEKCSHSPPPSLSCQDGTRRSLKAGLTVVPKADSSLLLPLQVATVTPKENDRKRRSCSMDAAAILASVSILRPALLPSLTVSSLPADQMKPLLSTGFTASSSSASGPDSRSLQSLTGYTGMPDALPIRTSVSPFQNTVVSSPESFDAAKGDFESAVASIPPPLSVTIDEQRQSIRLRIKASVWNASSAHIANLLPRHEENGHTSRRKSSQSTPQTNEKISPIRVKKKVEKKSSSAEVKKNLLDKTAPLNCIARKALTTQPRKRGRPPLRPALSSAIDPSDTMKLALTAGLSKISCKDLLLDFTSTSSPLSVARFELLDMRKKFEQMPAAVQYEIMRLLPKSWTVAGEDGQVSLKAGAMGKADSKFRHHLATWQSNLAAGEYDTEVRRKFIDIAVANLDPWKVENFEPVYGQIMAGCWRNASTAGSTWRASLR